MIKKQIKTNSAPNAIGPYSQAIMTESTLFLSGQIPINPETGNIDSTSIRDQAKQVLENIKNILTSQQLSMENIVKTTVFLTDLNNFSEMNSVYEQYFIQPFPARSCVEISKLPKDSLIEIECIAVL